MRGERQNWSQVRYIKRKNKAELNDKLESACNHSLNNKFVAKERRFKENLNNKIKN